MTIGQNIRRIRREKGITQWQLSSAIDVTPGTILLIERGSRGCTADMVRDIAKALGVPEDRLTGGTDDGASDSEDTGGN